MADKKTREVVISTSSSAKLLRWRVCPGSEVREGSVLCFYEIVGGVDQTGSFITQPKLKSAFTGKVRKLLVAEGEIVAARAPVLLIDEATECEHGTVMKDLCCDCGADLRKLRQEKDEPSSPILASVPLIHNIPELKVSQEIMPDPCTKSESKMVNRKTREVVISTPSSAKLLRWRVHPGSEVREGSVLCLYEIVGDVDRAGSFITRPKLKSAFKGKVRKLLVAEGEIVAARAPVLLIDEATECEHGMVMKDLCCDCGADLRKLNEEKDEPSSPTLASVPIIHNIPELKVSQEKAEALGKKDKERLLQTRKLSLVVDLDQTLIHTTIELIPEDMEDVHHFQLPGYPAWYHTKIRPGAVNFLNSVSSLFELHIFTMGSRMYAHTIAGMLDPGGKLFAHRIRSRDECFNPFSKSRDLRALFPSGDNMVCLIDDREDVWNFAANLIRVKPYQFFKGVGDINAPPGGSVPVTEDINPPGNPGDQIETTEGDAKVEESNSREDNEGDVTEQKKNDAVFDDNGETKQKVANVETKEIHELVEDVQISTDSIEPDVEEKEQSKIEKAKITEKAVKERETSFRVVENGGGDSASNETVKDESTEIQTSSENTRNGKQDTDRKAQDDSEQQPSDESVSTSSKTLLKSEGDQTKIKKSRQQVYEFGDGDDDYLLHLEDILRRIHDAYYKTVESIQSQAPEEVKNNPNIVKYCTPGTLTPDTKLIVTELRRDVLRGANVVFTGVIPTSTKQEDSQPWRVACALGARVNNVIITPKDTNCDSDVTTHVIAGRLGTEKSYRAVKSRGVKLVNPGWLFCCFERWEKVDERLFPVEGLEKYKQQVRDHSTPRGTPGETTDSSAVEKVILDLNVFDKENVAAKSRSDSASSADLLMSTLNPLLSFSPSEVEAMDKEVEDLMNDSDGESDLIGSVSESSSSPDPEKSESTSKRKRENERDSLEDKNELASKKVKLDDDDDDKQDEGDEKIDCDELSRSPDSDDHYTRRSTPSDDEDDGDDDDDDDDDDMAAMLDAELSHSEAAGFAHEAFRPDLNAFRSNLDPDHN